MSKPVLLLLWLLLRPGPMVLYSVFFLRARAFWNHTCKTDKQRSEREGERESETVLSLILHQNVNDAGSIQTITFRHDEQISFFFAVMINIPFFFFFFFLWHDFLRRSDIQMESFTIQEEKLIVWTLYFHRVYHYVDGTLEAERDILLHIGARPNVSKTSNPVIK